MAAIKSSLSILSTCQCTEGTWGNLKVAVLAPRRMASGTSKVATSRDRPVPTALTRASLTVHNLKKIRLRWLPARGAISPVRWGKRSLNQYFQIAAGDAFLQIHPQSSLGGEGDEPMFSAVTDVEANGGGNPRTMAKGFS